MKTEAGRSLDTILGRSNGRSSWDFGREADRGVFSLFDLESNDLKNFPVCLKIVGFDLGSVDSSVRVGLGGDGRSSSSEE